MNILAIGAHPDDIEYGCAGALIYSVDRGHNVHLMICTRGSAGGDPDLREQEQEKSSEIIGAKEIFWGPYRDTYLPKGKKLIDRMEKVIHQVQPNFIFVNYWDDTHQDHRTLAQAALAATRYIPNVLFYETPTSQNFSPQIYVNIVSSIERKLDALRAHSSQVMKTNIEGLSILEIAQASATFRGIQGRVKLAEAFVPVRFFVSF
jgi:LmbE family N-acetylglucosaminyl deacetylase